MAGGAPRHPVRYAPDLARGAARVREQALSQRPAQFSCPPRSRWMPTPGSARPSPARRGPHRAPARRTSISKPARAANIEVVRAPTAAAHRRKPSSSSARCWRCCAASRCKGRMATARGDASWVAPRSAWSAHAARAPTGDTLLLPAFGARVIGYDPSLHHADPLWGQWGHRALRLARADAGRRRGQRAARPTSRATAA